VPTIAYRAPLIRSIAVACVASLGASALLGSDTFAAATIGTPIQVPVAAAPKSSAEALKDEYRRPAEIPFPASNPFTPEKLKLGKTLYYDTRLSGSGAQSCASCHNPGYGWGDGLAKGVGDGMKELKRRSPTIVNAAWGLIFMWDGRAPTLEDQALGPIQAAVEMNMPLDKLLERLNGIAEYKTLFEAAFPGEGITPAGIGKAIATFERTAISGWAPFDSWIEGDAQAISASAQRGFALFNGKAQCNTCHVGWNFTDDSFHDIGLKGADIGRGAFLGVAVKMKQAFKTPGLRDIVRRSPYMHDGSLATLEAVVEHYDTGGVARPSRSDLIKPLGLTAEEKADLVAFMKTLTGSSDVIAQPIQPR
jgi:cytochrome c peroxidase